MDDDNHFNASWERCGSCRYRGGERRLELSGGTARWVGCRKNEPCPHRNGSPRRGLRRLGDFCRKWLGLQ